ncbi:hypothetical protein NKG94_39105 [Micromonospora sp. M12]
MALVGALTGCSLFDGGKPGTSVAQPSPGVTGGGTQPEIPTTVAAGQVSLLQRLGADGPMRTLSVARDGAWQCVDCAGDGVSSRAPSHRS